MAGSKLSFSQLETAGPNPENSSALVFSIGVFGSVQGGVAGVHLKIKGLRDSGLESMVGQSDKYVHSSLAPKHIVAIVPIY